MKTETKKANEYKKFARPDVKLLKAKGSSRKTVAASRRVAKTPVSDGGRSAHATHPSSLREEQRERKAAPPLLKVKDAPRFIDKAVKKR